MSPERECQVLSAVGLDDLSEKIEDAKMILDIEDTTEFLRIASFVLCKIASYRGASVIVVLHGKNGISIREAPPNNVNQPDR